MKIELKRSVRQIYKDTKEEDIKFEIVFNPEDVDDALKLKELEEIRKETHEYGYYDDKWEENRFIIILS